MQISSIYFFPLWALLLLVTGCRTGENLGTGLEDQIQVGPERVDIRGFINTRDYGQGQVVIFVEGLTDPSTRFDRALVLVTPVTQITDTNGRAMNYNELAVGQRVAIQFRGRFRETVSGRGAQAIARRMWVEVRPPRP